MTQILMPALSPTMEEGNLAKWLVKPGDKIEPGQVIAEIETDKATMEVEAVDEGVISEILVPEGAEGVKVNTPIAIIAAEGEDASAVSASPAKAPAETATACSRSSSTLGSAKVVAWNTRPETAVVNSTMAAIRISMPRSTGT